MGETGAARRARGRAPDPRRVATTRQQILRAALDSFLAHGFEGTRMADVAARAGLAKGTLYLHFEDKDALFEFVLRELVSEPLARFRASPVPDGETVRAFLARLILPLLGDLEASGRGAVLRLIITEGGRSPALARLHRSLVIEPALEAVRRKVEEAVAGGEDRLAPLLRYPQLVAAPVVLATVWNGFWGSEQPIDTASMFEAFLDLAIGAGE